MKNYLKKSQNKPKIENYIYNRIVVFEKNKLPDHISISKIINFLEQKIPKHLFQNIDYVFIGEDPEFEKRKINAFYKDSAIYTTHLQDLVPKCLATCVSSMLCAAIVTHLLVLVLTVFVVS